MISWLYRFLTGHWWRQRQRAIDIALLWPECKRAAPSLDAARQAFTLHAFNDPAWLELEKEDVFELIEGLQ